MFQLSGHTALLQWPQGRKEGAGSGLFEAAKGRVVADFHIPVDLNMLNIAKETKMQILSSLGTPAKTPICS